MAYNTSSYYYETVHDHRSEYYLTSYAHDYDDSAAVSYSSYEDPSFHNLLEYHHHPNPTPYYHANYNIASPASYSNPISSYDTGKTQFLISYSVSPEFNEPEIDDYDEYDPTPYGGGYSITAQYGRPLQPSNVTCYPRSGSSPPPDLKPPNHTGAIVPVSPGGKEAVADEKDAKPIKEISKEEEPISRVLAIENGVDSKSHEEEETNNEGEVYNTECESGRGLYDQVPSGYGLEAMDICESLFGYWPCLARDLNRSNGKSGHRFSCEERYENLWSGTADYLFGSSNPYGERSTSTYYEYGAQYLGQTHLQVEYEDYN